MGAVDVPGAVLDAILKTHAVITNKTDENTLKRDFFRVFLYRGETDWGEWVKVVEE